MRIVGIVLTWNEEKHLARCIESISGVVDEIFIADCHSTDKTEQIAKDRGVRFKQHPWKNHATQFNWALAQLESDVDWVLRIDADEYLTPELALEIQQKLAVIDDETQGIFLPRRMAYMGRLIQHGGIFPGEMLRLFRNGKGQCENRWMDEHIKVDGGMVVFENELIDDNLNPLSWWIDKHNKYASREVVDILNREHRFMYYDSVASLSDGSQASTKRWIKENVYSKLPIGVGPLLYFVYRYFIRFGFLDGKEGAAFHFLQGFWYRYLVDLKLMEVNKYIKLNQCKVTVAIKEVLDIDVEGAS
jgi:glycosyltransferase involved in cell wall biosynthesis